jgi:MFS family permease
MPAHFKHVMRHRLFFSIAITVVYFVINMILILYHEQWREEASATSLAVMSLSVFLLACYAPLAKASVVVLVLSAAFFYFNAAVSETYCWVVLGTVVAIVAYWSRLVRPVRLALTLGAVGVSVFLVLPMVTGALERNGAQRDWLIAVNKTLFGVTAPLLEIFVVFVLVYLFFRYTPRRPTKLHDWAQKLEMAKLMKRVSPAVLLVVPAAATIPFVLITALNGPPPEPTTNTPSCPAESGLDADITD